MYCDGRMDASSNGTGSVRSCLGPLVSVLSLIDALVRTLLCPRRVGAILDAMGWLILLFYPIVSAPHAL